MGGPGSIPEFLKEKPKEEKKIEKAPEPKFEKREIIGGPNSIPEFLKEKPKEEKKIEKAPVLRK